MKSKSTILSIGLTKKKIHFLPSIVYAQVATLENPNHLLKLDLLQPQASEKLPVIIFITGGGFISANRARMPQLRMFLAEAGYAVASISYRTVPNSTFPAPIIDVKSAIRFLKANADKYNLNKQNISLMGDSAGGYLTTFASITNGSPIFNDGDYLDESSNIVSAVDLYGVLDIGDVAGFPFMAQALGNTPLKDTDPIKYISENSTPMLIMHGTDDDIVPSSHSDKLFQALRAANIDAEYYLVKNAGHADEYWLQNEIFNLILNFFDKHMRS